MIKFRYKRKPATGVENKDTTNANATVVPNKESVSSSPVKAKVILSPSRKPIQENVASDCYDDYASPPLSPNQLIIVEEQQKSLNSCIRAVVVSFVFSAQKRTQSYTISLSLTLW